MEYTFGSWSRHHIYIRKSWYKFAMVLHYWPLQYVRIPNQRLATTSNRVNRSRDYYRKKKTAVFFFKCLWTRPDCTNGDMYIFSLSQIFSLLTTVINNFYLLVFSVFVQNRKQKQNVVISLRKFSFIFSHDCSWSYIFATRVLEILLRTRKAHSQSWRQEWFCRTSTLFFLRWSS